MQEQTNQAANKYAQIRSEIEDARLIPWSSVTSFEVGDFELSPLTLRSMSDLAIAGNAFLQGGEASEMDVITYIWRHSEGYSPSGDKHAFYRKVLKSKSVKGLAAGVKSHVESAFMDSPKECNFGGVSKQNSLPPIAPIAALCSEYGSAFGIDPLQVADVDLRIVFQCCRAIRMRAGNVTYLEPQKLREAKKEYLENYATNVADS
jgi:hypothetical protein